MPYEPILSDWLRSMSSQGRCPKVVTTRLPILGQNALERLLLKRFDPLRRIGPVQVWLAKRASVPRTSFVRETAPFRSEGGEAELCAP
jgi:hypothetical protein